MKLTLIKPTLPTATATIAMAKPIDHFPIRIF
jgi:hypothetical protein